MGIFDWFTAGSKDDIADLEEIKIEPVVKIPEQTRRELYNAAVAEVQAKRVQELIHRGILLKTLGEEVYNQTESAIAFVKEEGWGLAPVDEHRRVVLERFPLARNVNVYNNHCTTFGYSGLSLRDLADVLAKEYMEALDEQQA